MLKEEAKANPDTGNIESEELSLKSQVMELLEQLHISDVCSLKARIAEDSSLKSVSHEFLKFCDDFINQKRTNLNEFVSLLVCGRVRVLNQFLSALKTLQEKAEKPSTPQPLPISGFKGEDFFRFQEFDVIQLLKVEIKRCWENFHNNPNRYYAPLIHIFQSSGYGKSRACFELSELFQEAYLCCRPREVTTGEPSRSLVIMDYLEKMGSHSAFSWGLFMLVVWIVREKRNLMMNKTWVKCMLTDGEFAKEFWSTVRNIHEHIILMPRFSTLLIDPPGDFEATEMKISSTLREIYWRTCQNKPPEQEKYSFNFEDLCLPNCDLSKFNDEKPGQLPPLPFQDPLFLFILDEASRLLIRSQKRYLRSFRRGLRCLALWLKIVVLTLDTNAKVSNFMPKIESDPSDRVSAGTHSLFRPFFLFPLQVNLLGGVDFSSFEYHFKEKVGETEVNVLVSFNPIHLFRCSRILFSSFYKDYVASCRLDPDRHYKAVCTTINMAHKKLLFLQTGAYDEELSNTALFAIMACRFYLMSTVGHEKEMLIHQHLATFHGFSTDDNNDPIASYSSEPMLAEAAMQATRNSDRFEKSLNVLKSKLSSCLHMNSGGKGELGELVACIILLRCFEVVSMGVKTSCDPHTSQTEHLRGDVYTSFTCREILSRPIPLVSFLNRLLEGHPDSGKFFEEFGRGLNNDIPGGSSLPFQQSLVQFNHFIKLEYQLSQQDLLYYYNRFAAVVCVVGETGVDVVIPIAVPKALNVPVDMNNPESFVMSSLSVQVKNVKDPIHMDEIVRVFLRNKLVESISFEPDAPDQLLLFMNINEGYLQQGEMLATKETRVPRLHFRLYSNGNVVPPVPITRFQIEQKKKKFFFLQLCGNTAYPNFLGDTATSLLREIRDDLLQFEIAIKHLKESLSMTDEQIRFILENRDPGKRLSHIERTKMEGKEI